MHVFYLPYWGPFKVILFSMWEHIPTCPVTQACGAWSSKRIKLSQPSYSPDIQYMHSTKSLNMGRTHLIQCKDWDVGSRVFVGGLNKGRTQPGSLEWPRCGLRSVCQDEQGVDPAAISAGTNMWAQECFSGAWTRAGPGLVQRRDPDMGSGVFPTGFSKCWTQPSSV